MAANSKPALRNKPRHSVCWGLLLSAFLIMPVAAEEYLSVEQFLQQSFGNQAPVAAKLWLSAEQREVAEQTLGYHQTPLRVRYWRLNGRTAWVLKEIGKERPITIGVSINAGKVEAVRILAFEESRGWEVRFPYFTDQFNGVDVDKQLQLDRRIDGITGATMSVAAVKKVVRWALYLDHGLAAEQLANAH